MNKKEEMRRRLISLNERRERIEGLKRLKEREIERTAFEIDILNEELKHISSMISSIAPAEMGDNMIVDCVNNKE